MAQVFIESEPETQHTEIEERSYGQYQSGDDVEPLLSEGARMGMGGQERIVVEFGKHNLVSRVAQILDGLF